MDNIKLVKRKQNTAVNIFDISYIVYRYLIPDLKDAIDKYAFGNVLDVGCGNKPYLSLFKNKIDNYIGCDVVQSSLKLVDVLCPATDLKFENNSFDTVFSTQVLEHVYDHKKAFFEISRVLKTNGNFIGSLPMTWPHHEEPHDFFRFTKYGLALLLEEVGLSIEYIKPNGGKWAMLGQLIILNFTEKPEKPSLLSKIKNIMFRITLSKVWINIIFGNLDKISSHSPQYNTLNFVFVAKKMK